MKITSQGIIENILNICFNINIKIMTRKKNKPKNLKKKSGIVKITNLAAKSFLSNAFSNYKKK